MVTTWQTVYLALTAETFLHRRLRSTPTGHKIVAKLFFFFFKCLLCTRVFLGGSAVKNPPANAGEARDAVWSLDQETATHSSILAGRIPWTEELLGCRPWCRGVEHGWVTKHARCSGHGGAEMRASTWARLTVEWANLIKQNSFTHSNHLSWESERSQASVSVPILTAFPYVREHARETLV